jgi:hypothetical protein
MDICKAQVPALEQIGPDHRVACFLISDKSVTVAKRNQDLTQTSAGERGILGA